MQCFIGTAAARLFRVSYEWPINLDPVAVARDHIGFLELNPAGAYSLDFPAMQGNTGFKAVLDKVVMESFSVVNYGHVMGQ